MKQQYQRFYLDRFQQFQYQIHRHQRTFFEQNAFTFHYGLEANGPILPKPRTAVPLLTTATKLPRAVYFAAAEGSRSISKHGAATPGE